MKSRHIQSELLTLPFVIDSCIFNLVKLLFEDKTEMRIMTTKSVKDLEDKMGDSYKDLAAKVAFKEGYNQCIKDFKSN